MIVKSLELENYRNYKSLSLTFGEKTNLLYGKNAQGKTNAMEAIYLCAVTRSHRGSKDRELISFGEEEAHIKCVVQKKRGDERIDIHLKKGKNKGIAVDGVPLRRASDVFGNMIAVFFSPEDLSIVKKGPSDRRRFLDMELCQLDPIYSSCLFSYNRILIQKNQLLKDIGIKPSLRETLDVWNEQLVRYGREIIKRRKKFIEDINPVMEKIHGELTLGREKLKIIYEPSIGEEEFTGEIQRIEEREIKGKSSLIGPHRDDIRFQAGDIDVKTFGSQGQQRTVSLSLKLSEIEMIKKIRGENPVLLLDDVMSELDRDRQNQLIKRIQGIQTIITCTGMEDFVKDGFSIDRIYRVENGTVTVEKE